jgi:ABC-2 type transport system ATP-binding protein
VTLFVTTHYMDEASHAHRLAFIYDGRIIAEGSPDSIKSGVMRDTILEVTVSDADAALAALEAADAVKEAYLNGAFVHANVGGLDLGKADLAGVLERAGLPGATVAVVDPTLEDVFVHLVGEERRKETP